MEVAIKAGGVLAVPPTHLHGVPFIARGRTSPARCVGGQRRRSSGIRIVVTEKWLRRGHQRFHVPLEHLVEQLLKLLEALLTIFL